MNNFQKLKMRDRAELIGDEVEPDSIPVESSSAELAKLLEVTQRNIDILAQRGVLARLPNRKFDTADSIRRYVAFARKSTNSELEAEKIRLTQAQAAKVELQNAAANGQLVPAADVQAEWSSILRDVRAAILAIPSRIQPRLGHLTPHDIGEIDREIRAALTESAQNRPQTGAGEPN